MLSIPEIEMHLQELERTSMQQSDKIASLESNLEELRDQLQVGRKPTADCGICMDVKTQSEPPKNRVRY